MMGIGLTVLHCHMMHSIVQWTGLTGVYDVRDKTNKKRWAPCQEVWYCLVCQHSATPLRHRGHRETNTELNKDGISGLLPSPTN
jgi:hypothetical protein